VLGLILRSGMAHTGIGVALGALGALGLSSLLRAQLHGVSPVSPAVYGGVALLLAGVALLACWIPARRAARVDPLVALRCD
jgi:ABC-type antimicrobial peptide transport system permease subunit